MNIQREPVIACGLVLRSIGRLMACVQAVATAAKWIGLRLGEE
jgi:hypothetical protein